MNIMGRTEIKILQRYVERLEKINSVYKEALEFYANSENYDNGAILDFKPKGYLLKNSRNNEGISI